MPYRRIDTRIWHDPWFEGLDKDCRYIFIYLWTNDHCNQAGLYEISIKRIAFETGFSENELDAIFNCLSPKVEIHGNWILVKGFIKYQSCNDSFLKAAHKAALEAPIALYKAWCQHNGIEPKPQTRHSVDTMLTPCDHPDTTHPSSVQNSTVQNSAEKKTFSSDSVEIRLSKKLFSLIKKRNSNHKQPDFQKWAKHIDLMLKRDNREPAEIEVVIEWCQSDEFWQNNILSTSKLREQFDALYLKMQGEANGKNWNSDRKAGFKDAREPETDWRS